jgi:alkylation response protein AidB-like acyl-CoA dehydrogenase
VTIESFPEIRGSVRRLCAEFPGTYWQAKDRDRAYPTEFVETLTREGFLSVLIPEEFGGSGLGLGAATAILEEIHRSGCNGGACHAQMYVMGTVLKHGSAQQKAQYLPAVASGPLRLQAATSWFRSKRATSRVRRARFCAARRERVARRGGASPPSR